MKPNRSSEATFSGVSTFRLFKSEKMDSLEMRCTPVMAAKASEGLSFKAPVSQPFNQLTASL